MKKPQVIDSKDPVLWCKEASSRMEAGDLNGALYCYNESVKIRPEVPDVWFNISCICDKLGRRKEAIDCCTASHKMFPSDFRFPAEKARMLAESKKYSQALTSISEALTINPDLPILLSNKAGYLIFSGYNDEAVSYADKALKIDPQFSSAYIQKAHALVNLGKIDEAESVLDIADKTIPENANILKMQANLFIRTGSYNSGLEKINRVVMITPKDDEAWSLKGAVHAYLNEKDNAVKAFEKAVKLNPKQKTYRTNLKAVLRT